MIEIAAELQRQMKDIEYKFDTKFMMWKRRTKDASLFPAHSKNLAIAFWPLQHLLVFRSTVSSNHHIHHKDSWKRNDRERWRLLSSLYS
jgi:hypothetical protein